MSDHLSPNTSNERVIGQPEVLHAHLPILANRARKPLAVYN